MDFQTERGMKKILIIQTAFIGDVVLATPLIEKLHHQFPHAEIDFLLKKGCESLLQGHPKLHTTYVLNKNNKYKELLRLIREFRSRQYDLVINLQRFFSSGIITVLSGAKQTIGFDKNPLSAFYTKRIEHSLGNGSHEVERNIRLIEHLCDPIKVSPKLYPSILDFETVNAYKNCISIAPTSVWHTKQWPARQWAKLIHLYPCSIQIVLLGASGDEKQCQEIIQISGQQNVINLAGKLTMLQTCALMKGSTMNYVNDSAPLHFASAMNAPVTAVFCSTIPEFGFGPLSKNSKVVQTSEKLDCRPCGIHGYKTCPKGHFKCSEIDVKEVFSPQPPNNK